MAEEELGLAREARGGDGGGEVEQPAHGERLEGEAEAEQVGEDGPERRRPAAALEEDQRRVAQPQRDGRVPRAPRGGHSETCTRPSGRGRQGGSNLRAVSGYRESSLVVDEPLSARRRRRGRPSGLAAEPARDGFDDEEAAKSSVVGRPPNLAWAQPTHGRA